MSWPINNTFDPFHQPVTFLGPDGITPITVSLAFLHKVQVSTVQKGICEGSQVGASTLLLTCLFLLTKTDKRRSLVFILNAIALLLVAVRGVLTSVIYTGPFYDWYIATTAWYDNLGSAQAVSIAAELASVLLVIVLELSLSFQIRIVCCTLEPIWRCVVNSVNALVALMVVGTRIALAVLDIRWNILGLQNETEWQFNRTVQLGSAANILFVVSIGISATIFCAKLAFAIRRRRSMGMTQFGPMQIIFIMGFQTMCAPFIFLLITYYGVKNARMQSFSSTVVALCLPLSALWAAANTNVRLAEPNLRSRGAVPIGHEDLASGKSYGTASTTMSDTLIDDNSTTATSPGKDIELGKQFQSDLEMQKLDNTEQFDHSHVIKSTQSARMR